MKNKGISPSQKNLGISKRLNGVKLLYLQKFHSIAMGQSLSRLMKVESKINDFYQAPCAVTESFGKAKLRSLTVILWLFLYLDKESAAKIQSLSRHRCGCL